MDGPEDYTPRLCTGVGRTKLNLKKWRKIIGVKEDTNFERGEVQSMAHLQACNNCLNQMRDRGLVICKQQG